MKKILFVIDSLNCGGAEKSLLALLSALDSTKYEKHLWILNQGGVFDKIVPGDVIVEKQPEYNKMQLYALRIGQLIFSYRIRHNKKKCHNAELYWKSCGRFIKGLKQQYDIAVAYQQGVPTYIVATKISAKKKLAWINVDIKKGGYNIKYNVSFYNKMLWIVCVSDLLESIVRNIMPQFVNRIRCVYDIVSPDLVRDLSKGDVPELKDKPSGRLVLTTVARMATQKNYPLAIQTASLLRQRGVDFTWLFVGNGPNLWQIRRLIKKNGLTDCVYALGLRTNPYPYINACDIYVQTSSYEGFGLTIAEAKILCKPIVSTDFEVVHNQLKDGVNGLITSMTPEALADAICTLANDKSMCQRFATALKDSVKGNEESEAQKVDQLFLS